MHVVLQEFSFYVKFDDLLYNVIQNEVFSRPNRQFVQLFQTGINT